MKELIKLGKTLWETPEPGYLEWKTNEILNEAFQNLGFQVAPFPGMPGFSASYPFKKPADGVSWTPGDPGTVSENSPEAGPKIALIADMDALPNPSAGGGGYIHSCGHHQQMTVLYGAARLLLEEDPVLASRILFIAVPAEEFIDFEKRELVIREGRVEKYSGKQELLRRGFFDSLDCVIATHSSGSPKGRFMNSVVRMNGFERLNFIFTGRSSHAGASPHLGLNAQNSAALFLQACAFLRETFQEEHHLRIHPVLRLSPNQSVNLIPDKAFVETYVRSSDSDALKATVEKLSLAASGVAQALGCRVERELTEGYKPFQVDPGLHYLAEKVCRETNFTFLEEAHSSASSDMGDLSQIKPSVIIGLPGSNGLFHNPDFRILDEEEAYIESSRFMAAYLKEVLRGGVVEGRFLPAEE